MLSDKQLNLIALEPNLIKINFNALKVHFPLAGLLSFFRQMLCATQSKTNSFHLAGAASVSVHSELAGLRLFVLIRA